MTLGRMLAIFFPSVFLALGCCGCGERNPLGGNRLQLSAPRRQDASAWSQTGALAYRDNGIVCIAADFTYTVDTTKVGIWIVPAGGGAAYRFLSNGTEAAWSPSGDTLAVAQSNSIVLYEVPTGRVLHTMPTGEMPFYLSWAPTGGYLLWTQAYDRAGVYCAELPVLAAVRIAADGGYQDWDPVMKAVLYMVADGKGETVAFREVDPGTGRIDTLFTARGVLKDQRVSPTGDRIVFAEYDASVVGWDLYSVARDGTDRMRLTQDGGVRPAWNSSGDALMYVREALTSKHPAFNVIWYVDVLTMSKQQVTYAWPESCWR